MNFPLHYENSEFYDRVSSDGGGTDLSEATATAMGTVTVAVNDAVVYTYDPSPLSQVYGDLLLTGVTNLNKAGVTSFSGSGLDNTFGFDLLDSSGSILSLRFNNSDIGGYYNARSNGTPLLLFLGGSISSIASPNLPNGLTIDGSDTAISMSATSFSNVQWSDDGKYVTRFDVNVTGTIIGTSAPEPGTLVLLTTGLLSFLVYAWRKPRQAA